MAYRMVGYCQLPETGAVGVKLLYPDTKNIQHCGVINIQNGPVHCFGNMPMVTIILAEQVHLIIFQLLQGLAL